MMSSIYAILPRFDYLRGGAVFKTCDYCRKFEVSRSTFMRDLEKLKDIYNLFYKFDMKDKVWRLEK